MENAQFRTERGTFFPALQSKQFRPQFPSLSRRFVETPNRPLSRNPLFLNKTRPAPEMGLGGRTQRKRGAERENRVISAESPGQAFLEKPFISRVFSKCAGLAETGQVGKAWRSEGNRDQTLSVAISMGYECHSISRAAPLENHEFRVNSIHSVYGIISLYFTMRSLPESESQSVSPRTSTPSGVVNSPGPSPACPVPSTRTSSPSGAMILT